MFDFYYKFHPMTELFNVSDPSYLLVKPGSTNYELSQIENVLISELEGQFDNLPDAIRNLLDLPFWDTSYMPFVTMVASIPIEISEIVICEHRLSINIRFPQSANVNFTKVMIQKKNNMGRQVGLAQTISQFNRMNDSMISADEGLELSENINFLTVKLYYSHKLLEERYFIKDRDTLSWIER